MNRLSAEKRALILRCLCEGMSVRGAARTAGCAKGTVLKLLIEAGRACDRYLDRELTDLPCRRIQVDECWTFLWAKQKNVPTARAAPEGSGDLWTWTAICADTKLVPSWLVGDRTHEMAIELFRDLRGRIPHRIQITTDGLDAYFEAVPYVFGQDGADFAAVVKLYGDPEHAVHVTGRPDPDHINTCYVERHYATMRSGMKRYARRSIGFSRKLLNHAAMLSVWMYAYNFVQPHRSLTRKGGPPPTPAMAAGITDWRMTMHDVVNLIDHSN